MRNAGWSDTGPPDSVIKDYLTTQKAADKGSAYNRKTGKMTNTKEAFGCVGHTIKLASGAYFDLSDPDPMQIKIQDIAGALSKICRFGGHVNEFYSVAEHCCLAADEAFREGHSPEECLAVLLHDAAEAYVGDMVKPLKMLVGASFSEVEENVEHAIEMALGVDFKKHDEVIKTFDRGMLMAERRRFFNSDSVVWYGEKEAVSLNPYIAPMSDKNAKRLFLEIYDRLRTKINETADVQTEPKETK